MKKNISTYQSIGRRLHDLRIQNHISADDLAEAVGKDRTSIYRWERGDVKNIPISAAITMSKLFKISLKAMFAGTELDFDNYTNKAIETLSEKETPEQESMDANDVRSELKNSMDLLSKEECIRALKILEAAFPIK